jgi:thiamine pyrophosphokinase
MRAIVLADGEAVAAADLDRAWPGWNAGIELVVAADGGVRLAEPLGLIVDRWVGDGDSLEPALEADLRRRGIPVLRAPEDKDESDTELALVAAIDAGATDISIIAALGGARFDHALANVGLLAHPRLGDRACRLLGPGSRVTLLTGPVEGAFEGRAGDIVSLLPFGAGVAGVRTAGLRYPLRDEPLPAGPARGLSNVRTEEVARVRVEGGRLLVVEIPGTFRP